MQIFLIIHGFSIQDISKWSELLRIDVPDTIEYCLVNFHNVYANVLTVISIVASHLLIDIDEIAESTNESSNSNFAF